MSARVLGHATACSAWTTPSRRARRLWACKMVINIVCYVTVPCMPTLRCCRVRTGPRSRHRHNPLGARSLLLPPRGGSMQRAMVLQVCAVRMPKPRGVAPAGAESWACSLPRVVPQAPNDPPVMLDVADKPVRRA